jgi:hypothetical protein
MERGWKLFLRIITRSLQIFAKWKVVVVVHVIGVSLYLWTAATNWAAVHSLHDIWVWGAMVDWYWQWNTKETWEKPVAVPLCLPQIPHRLTQTWTWAFVVREDVLSWDVSVVSAKVNLKYICVKCQHLLDLSNGDLHQTTYVPNVSGTIRRDGAVQGGGVRERIGEPHCCIK